MIRGLAHNRLSEVTSFDIFIGQGKLLFTKGLSFSLSYNVPDASYIIPSSGCLIYLNPPFYLWTSHVGRISDSHVCGILVCTILNSIFSCQSSCWFDYSANQKESEEEKGKFLLLCLCFSHSAWVWILGLPSTY